MLNLIILFSLASCISERNTESDDLEKRDVQDQISIGVLSINDDIEFKESDTVRIVSKDGSVYYNFSFYDSIRVPNDLLFPLAIDKDYFILEMEVLSIGENGLYQVIIHKDKQQVKYVVNDPTLRYTSWKDYLLQARTLGLRNTYLFQDSLQLNKIEVDVEYFVPLIVNGSWLYVVSNDSLEIKGWIKWRDSSGELNIYSFK